MIKEYSAKDFIPSHIFECGQVFRYTKIGDENYEIISKDKKAIVEKQNDKIILQADDLDYFENYFDLKTDYSEIKKELEKVPGLKDAIEFGKGVRILNQDPFETIISFIISANNNIKRIKQILENLSKSAGIKKDGFYAFPTLEQLVNKDVDFYKQLGLGYRSEYIEKTIRVMLDKQFLIDEIREKDTSDAREYLMQLSGVGPKVADCILLFAFQRYDVCPIDTWMKKIYFEFFGINEPNVHKMRDDFIQLFGEHAGIAQQYLFFYKRSFVD